MGKLPPDAPANAASPLLPALAHGHTKLLFSFLLAAAFLGIHSPSRAETQASSTTLPASLPGAELVWPSEPVARLWLAAAHGRRQAFNGWPKPLGEICASAGQDSSQPDSRGTAAAYLERECADWASRAGFSAVVRAGAFSLGRRYPLSRPFETFEGGWESRRVDAEAAAVWMEVPPLLETNVRHAFSPRTYLRFRASLRRDLLAWHRDATGSNVPVDADEVDMNEPTLGYLHHEGGFLTLTAGRFPIHWSPSPNIGLTLSDAVPFHDAVLATLKTKHVRYRFLVSGLETWLEGTPPGTVSSSDYPVGSEEWRQRNYPDSLDKSAHRRVYDERSKTLVAHRLEAVLGRAAFGFTEEMIFGGKRPDLREANPFIVFHNEFNEGYTNLGVSLDARLDLSSGLGLAAELFMDDLVYGPTESESPSPSRIGWMGEVQHAFAVRGWSCQHSFAVVRTDPHLYGYLQPYNTLYSRRVISSNHEAGNDPALVDKYVADFPMGYLRGADVLDFWYRLEAEGRRGTRAELRAGLLARGEAGTGAPYEAGADEGAPSGTPEREIRIRTHAHVPIGHGLALNAGLAWQGIRDAGNVSHQDASRFQGALGFEWRMP